MSTVPSFWTDSTHDGILNTVAFYDFKPVDSHSGFLSIFHKQPLFFRVPCLPTCTRMQTKAPNQQPEKPNLASERNSVKRAVKSNPCLADVRPRAKKPDRQWLNRVRTWEGKRGFGAKLSPLGAFHDGLCGMKANMIHWAVERKRAKRTARRWWNDRQGSVASETERATRRETDEWNPHHRRSDKKYAPLIHAAYRQDVHKQTYSPTTYVCIHPTRAVSHTDGEENLT